MRKSLSSRSASEHGFTLIELLVVIVIIGILIAIAVPSYLGFRARGADKASQANLRGAVPVAQTHFADQQTYVGMDTADLRAIDQAISPTIVVVSGTATQYCLAETIAGRTWSVLGPVGLYSQNGTCS